MIFYWPSCIQKIDIFNILLKVYILSLSISKKLMNNCSNVKPIRSVFESKSCYVCDNIGHSVLYCPLKSTSLTSVNIKKHFENNKSEKKKLPSISENDSSSSLSSFTEDEE